MNRRPFLTFAATSLPALAWAQDRISARPRYVSVGDTAPELRGVTMDKVKYSLADHTDKVRLVAFWATWCPTCRVEMPEFRRAHEKWSKSGFELVTVSIDKNLDDVLTYDKLVSSIIPVSQRFPKLWKGAEDYSDGFGRLRGTPMAFLIDRKNKVQGVFSGRMMAEQWAQVQAEIQKKA